MVKEIITRKEHVCDGCKKVILKRTFAEITKLKMARYDDKDNQIGIQFFKFYSCKKCCEQLEADIQSAIVSIGIESIFNECGYYAPTSRQ